MASSSRPVLDDPDLMRAVLLGMPGGVLILDADDRIVHANTAAEQLLDVSESNLIGELLTAVVIHHCAILPMMADARRDARSLSAYMIDLSLRKGRSVKIDAHVAPVAHHPGYLIVHLQQSSIALDLDRRTRQHQSLSSLSNLSAMLAHEVKNPLSGIKGAAQLLAQTVAGSDRDLTQLICDESDRICSLVDRMGVFEQAAPSERRSVNIHQVLGHVKLLAENGFARGIVIEEFYDPSLPDVDGDRDQLVQVLINLVKNAAEAVSPDGGRITLETKYQHGLRVQSLGKQGRTALPVMVCVKDNGEGIAEAVMDTLFEPFVSYKSKGNGLGLALVNKIIRDHGGAIDCESGNEGASFRIFLPMWKGTSS